MKRPLLALLAAVTFGSALAEQGRVDVSPAVARERGLTVSPKVPLEITLDASLGKAQTAVMSLVRNGRPLGGELPMRRDGGTWKGKLILENPGAHVLTLRLYEGQAVWAAALDLTALEPDQPGPKASDTAGEDLDFIVTEGKAGGDTSGWWGILAMLVLAGGVTLGTIGARRPKANAKPKAGAKKLEG